MTEETSQQEGSILLAVLIAIQMSPTYIHKYILSRRDTTTTGHGLFPDIKSAVGLLTLGWEVNIHRSTIRDITLDM